MVSLISLGFIISIYSVLIIATSPVSSQPKRDKCGSGYGTVIAKDCLSLLNVQIPGADDPTPRQYVPRLSWSDRTSTGLSLPIENTPKSWNYGTCSLGLFNLKTQLGPKAGVEESSWQEIHRSFQNLINECATGRGTGGADTVGTHNSLITYIHSSDSKVLKTLTDPAIRTVGICPTDFTSLNTPETCPAEEQEGENGQQQYGTTYCEAGNGQGTSQSNGCSSNTECTHLTFQSATELLLGALFGEDDIGTCG